MLQKVLSKQVIYNIFSTWQTNSSSLNSSWSDLSVCLAVSTTVCLSMSVYLHVCLSVSFLQPVCRLFLVFSVCFSLSVFLCVRFYVCVSLSLCLCVFVCLTANNTRIGLTIYWRASELYAWSECSLTYQSACKVLLVWQIQASIIHHKSHTDCLMIGHRRPNLGKSPSQSMASIFSAVISVC